MSDHPFLDVQCPHCKDGTACTPYIQIYASEAITEANKLNKDLPKYGINFRGVCPQCGKSTGNLKQPPEIIGKRFILIPE